jgi:hypothetical protein
MEHPGDNVTKRRAARNGRGRAVTLSMQVCKLQHEHERLHRHGVFGTWPGASEVGERRGDVGHQLGLGPPTTAPTTTLASGSPRVRRVQERHRRRSRTACCSPAGIEARRASREPVSRCRCRSVIRSISMEFHAEFHCIKLLMWRRERIREFYGM